VTPSRDHGGGIDAAIARYGGTRAEWIDLSTGINPSPYPLPELHQDVWSALPDHSRIETLEDAARSFWGVPPALQIVSAGGASALIAALPHVIAGQTVNIPSPTYNEHKAAFEANGWRDTDGKADATVLVHPNNPDGRFWDDTPRDGVGQLIVDESFCDPTPDRSFVRGYSTSRVDTEDFSKTTTYAETRQTPPIILKSFGKFWGLAGLRLGFAICAPDIATKLRDQLGPWAVSGPACQIGALALKDKDWAARTRERLNSAALRMDRLLAASGFVHEGGTGLFRLVEVKDAKTTQDHLARHHILTRIFPYSDTWLRFGLPGAPAQWDQLETALKTHP